MRWKKNFKALFIEVLYSKAQHKALMSVIYHKSHIFLYLSSNLNMIIQNIYGYHGSYYT